MKEGGFKTGGQTEALKGNKTVITLVNESPLSEDEISLDMPDPDPKKFTIWICKFGWKDMTITVTKENEHKDLYDNLRKAFKEKNATIEIGAKADYKSPKGFVDISGKDVDYLIAQLYADDVLIGDSEATGRGGSAQAGGGQAQTGSGQAQASKLARIAMGSGGTPQRIDITEKLKPLDVTFSAFEQAEAMFSRLLEKSAKKTGSTPQEEAKILADLNVEETLKSHFKTYAQGFAYDYFEKTNDKLRETETKRVTGARQMNSWCNYSQQCRELYWYFRELRDNAASNTFFLVIGFLVDLVGFLASWVSKSGELRETVEKLAKEEATLTAEEKTLKQEIDSLKTALGNANPKDLQQSMKEELKTLSDTVSTLTHDKGLKEKALEGIEDKLGKMPASETIAKNIDDATQAARRIGKELDELKERRAFLEGRGPLLKKEASAVEELATAKQTHSLAMENLEKRNNEYIECLKRQTKTLQSGAPPDELERLAATVEKAKNALELAKSEERKQLKALEEPIRRHSTAKVEREAFDKKNPPWPGENAEGGPADLRKLADKHNRELNEKISPEIGRQMDAKGRTQKVLSDWQGKDGELKGLTAEKQKVSGEVSAYDTRIGEARSKIDAATDKLNKATSQIEKEGKYAKIVEENEKFKKFKEKFPDANAEELRQEALKHQGWFDYLWGGFRTFWGQLTGFFTRALSFTYNGLLSIFGQLWSKITTALGIVIKQLMRVFIEIRKYSDPLVSSFAEEVCEQIYLYDLKVTVQNSSYLNSHVIEGTDFVASIANREEAANKKAQLHQKTLEAYKHKTKENDRALYLNLINSLEFAVRKALKYEVPDSKIAAESSKTSRSYIITLRQKVFAEEKSAAAGESPMAVDSIGRFETATDIINAIDWITWVVSWMLRIIGLFMASTGAGFIGGVSLYCLADAVDTCSGFGKVWISVFRDMIGKDKYMVLVCSFPCAAAVGHFAGVELPNIAMLEQVESVNPWQKMDSMGLPRIRNLTRGVQP
jgi:hypothetical protein